MGIKTRLVNGIIWYSRLIYCDSYMSAALAWAWDPQFFSDCFLYFTKIESFISISVKIQLIRKSKAPPPCARWALLGCYAPEDHTNFSKNKASWLIIICTHIQSMSHNQIKLIDRFACACVRLNKNSCEISFWKIVHTRK